MENQNKIEEIEEIQEKNESKKKNKRNKSANEKKKKKSIRMLFLAVLGLIAVSAASVAYAWFFYKRQIETFTWIKTPIRLEIGSGNNHSIVYLDMGSIDADNETCSADYVFCVYGEPVDLYSLQLAYTTNIAFSYDIYRAEYKSNGGGNVAFTYNDGTGEKTESFQYDDAKSQAVISAKPLNELNDEQRKKHQSHNLSYGDEEGKAPADNVYVQSNAEPLYWLANENNLNVLKPKNIKTNSSGNQYFLDYFVIHVSWKKGTVINNKETDMVYLTVSR